LWLFQKLAQKKSQVNLKVGGESLNQRLLLREREREAELNFFGTHSTIVGTHSTTDLRYGLNPTFGEK
jgi:hypothetical protein